MLPPPFPEPENEMAQIPTVRIEDPTAPRGYRVVNVGEESVIEEADREESDREESDGDKGYRVERTSESPEWWAVLDETTGEKVGHSHRTEAAAREALASLTDGD